MLRHLLLFALTFVSLLTTIIPSLQAENSSADIAVVLLYLCGALVLQIAILISCWRFIGVKSAILAAAVLTSVNALALSLSFSENFLALPLIGTILVLLTITAVALLLYWASYQRSKFGLIVVFLYLVTILAQLTGMVPERGREASGKAALNLPQGIQSVAFHYFPNLYIVSFDSMIPETLAGKFLGKNFSKLEYSQYLRSAGAIIFQNVFADRVGTKPSLNALLNLSIDPYTDDKENQYRYFNGKTDSIVYRIFRENGYRISSGFAQASYFGQKGEYVDEYVFSERAAERFPFCEFRLEWFYLQFFGFCIASDAVIEKSDQSEWPAQVLASIKEKASSKNERWLSFYYVFNPIGHTSLDFSRSDEKAFRAYKQHFRTQVPELASFLRELLSSIRSRDPDGIIFIFGDHGTWLSRDLKMESNEQFWVQDRYGVFAAVVGAPRCRQGGELVWNGGFTTPSLILARLLSCLSGAKVFANAIPGQKWEHDFNRFRMSERRLASDLFSVVRKTACHRARSNLFAAGQF